MTTIFLLIVVALVILSFTISRHIKDDKDFLIPSGGLPFITVAFTMAASQFGSSMLIGGVQQAQQQHVGQGFYAAVYTLLAASLSCFINILISSHFLKQGEAITPPDFIANRYGKSRFMRGYHSTAYICSITCVLVSQFVGFASIGTAAGLSYTTAIVLCAVVVCLMALGSGLLGVAITDLIQFLLIVILLIISIYYSLVKLSTVNVSFAQVISEPFFPTAGLKSKFWYTAWPMIIGNMFSYEYFMRFMSCRSVKEAKRASMAAGVLLLITSLPVALLGAVANYCYQDADSLSVFGMIVNSDMPPFFGIVFMATVLMAVLTSADSMLASCSSLISKDIYGGLLNHNTPISELKNLKLVAKVSMVVIAMIATVFALFFKQILSITFYFSPFTSGTMFAPMIIGLFWSKANKKGAIASMICAAIAGFLHLTGIVTLFDRVAGPALIGTIAIVVFSLIFDNKNRLKG